MPHLPWLAATLLALSLPNPAASLSTTTTPSTPTSGLVEVDLIFPRQGATYDLTDTLPIVFAFRNLRTAVAIANLTFSYHVAPVDFTGITFPDEDFSIDASNVDRFSAPDGSTFLYVNTSDTTPSQWNLSLSSKQPSPFNLYTTLRFDACNPVLITNETPFNFAPAADDPASLPGVAGECAQEAIVASVYPQPFPTNTCSAIDSSERVSAEPCGVRLGAAEVSSLARRVVVGGDDGVTVTATGTATVTTTNPGGVPASPSPRRNLAVATGIPKGSAMVAAGVLGGLQFCL